MYAYTWSDPAIHQRTILSHKSLYFVITQKEVLVLQVLQVESLHGSGHMLCIHYSRGHYYRGKRNNDTSIIPHIKEFSILGFMRCQVLFLYPRAVMISNDSSKYNLVPSNPTRSSIVQTYRISNNNWYEVSASNFQFIMTASPRVSGPSDSRVSFTASGVPSTTSSPIASEHVLFSSHC